MDLIYLDLKEVLVVEEVVIGDHAGRGEGSADSCLAAVNVSSPLRWLALYAQCSSSIPHYVPFLPQSSCHDENTCHRVTL